MADKGLLSEKAKLQEISMEALREILTTSLRSNTSFIVGMIQEALKGNYPDLNLDNDTDLLVPDGEEINQMGEIETKEEAVSKMETVVLVEAPTPLNLDNDTDLLVSDGEEINQMGEVERKEEAASKMETVVLVEAPIPMLVKRKADSLLQDVGYNMLYAGQNQQLKKEEIYKNKMRSKGGFELKAKILREERAIIKHQILMRAQKFMKIIAGGRLTLKRDLYGINIWKKRKKKKKD